MVWEVETSPLIEEKFMADDIDRASETEDLQRSVAISSHRIDRTAVSATECKECGDAIEEARRIAVPGCTMCRDCQDQVESRNKHVKGGVA